MQWDERYEAQVRLMLRVLPLVGREGCFALKGGTAINLFVRNLPRLSVDVDLAYLPVCGRAESLREIDGALGRIRQRIRRAYPGCQVVAVELAGEGGIVKLLVRDGRVQVKIEVTPVLRGCVFEPEVRRVSAVLEERFGFAEMRVVSFEDLYGGKLVAALDRQHPRDLFDVKGLMEAEGISGRLREAFAVYLLSHNRPLAELLEPSRKELGREFAAGFEGMTEEAVTVDELSDTRERVIGELVGGMPRAHRRFLVSFEAGEPEWGLLGVSRVQDLPAVRWRMENLGRLSEAQRRELVARLERVFEGRHR